MQQFAAGSTAEGGDLLSTKIFTFKQARSFVKKLLREEKEEAQRVSENMSKAKRKESCDNVERMLRTRPTETDLKNRNVQKDVNGQAARRKNR